MLFKDFEGRRFKALDTWSLNDKFISIVVRIGLFTIILAAIIITSAFNAKADASSELTQWATVLYVNYVNVVGKNGNVQPWQPAIVQPDNGRRLLVRNPFPSANKGDRVLIVRCHDYTWTIIEVKDR